MKIKSYLDKLKLNPTNSIVIGSGILNALNIRESNDIDLVVSEVEYARFLKDSHYVKFNKHGNDVLTKDNIEISTHWIILGEEWTFDKSLLESIVINNIRYIKIEFLLKVKKSWISNGEGREKDINDVKLIERYLVSKEK